MIERPKTAEQKRERNARRRARPMKVRRFAAKAIPSARLVARRMGVEALEERRDAKRLARMDGVPWASVNRHLKAMRLRVRRGFKLPRLTPEQRT